MTKHEKIMAECLKLARKGEGYVSPNPLVGCIIMKDGHIIGKGYHHHFGGNHAEIEAILDAKSKGFKPKDSILYVNLEPCVHHGKTPPCVDRILQEKIKKVVIGTPDPNPIVKGKGIRKLREKGVEVITNVLVDESKDLNKFFFKYITTSLPYITLKVAQSLDGKIALHNFSSKYITSNESLKEVHRLRSIYDAVLVGKNTVLYDNPSLTVRLIKGRSPNRIILDSTNCLPADRKVFTDKYIHKTYVMVSTKALNKNVNPLKPFVNYIPIAGSHFNLSTVLKKLARLGIASVLIEGGKSVFSQFIQSKYFDELIIFISPKIVGQGISSFDDFKIDNLKQTKNLTITELRKLGNDIFIHLKK
ncbi:MAG: bifunctional diaminohydroxyphosphoribosylaminopyrimidine deaminase/5-amino-6-(5-phosphoribosylamino)uracil reductase RibD [Ignavibacteria bacterium]